MAKQAIVTLTTDFGLQDPYVAAMKGVILSACPRAQIVDISHGVNAQDVLAGAMVLAQAVPYFPPETLHVVVVDPGVGTDRRILAGRFGDQTLLFPDNGVITFLAEKLPLEAIAVVRNTAYLPADTPSATFHGRDIFAPLAGHLLNGVDLRKLGPAPETYKLLDLPVAQETADAITGQVIYVDHFGNLVSNIPAEMVMRKWGAIDGLGIWCAGRAVGKVQGAYGFAAVGEALAIFNSMGLVEVAINRGRASDALAAAVGAPVEVARR